MSNVMKVINQHPSWAICRQGQGYRRPVSSGARATAARLFPQRRPSRRPSVFIILCTSCKKTEISARAPPAPPGAPARMRHGPVRALFLSLAEEWQTVHMPVSHGTPLCWPPIPRTPYSRCAVESRTPGSPRTNQGPGAVKPPQMSRSGPPHGFQNGLWPLTPTAQSVPTVSEFFCRMTCRSFFGMSGSGQLPGSFQGRPSHGTCKKFSSGGGP